MSRSSAKMGRAAVAPFVILLTLQDRRDLPCGSPLPYLPLWRLLVCRSRSGHGNHLSGRPLDAELSMHAMRELPKSLRFVIGLLRLGPLSLPLLGV